MPGDAYRGSGESARVRELQEKHDALLARIRADSIKLERRYQAARVAERRIGKQPVAPMILVPIALSLLLIATLGWYAFPLFFVVAVVVVFGFARWLTRTQSRSDKLFDPSRYEQETAPAHLLAERKWLDRDQADADALAQEIEEANDLLAAQEKHDSR